ncbi:MAG: BrnT family toxin [Pseudohongiella sp.]|nr:BrnT family toxin [Pseudohongiella sp.]
MDFEFDSDKAVANYKKHGVSFREALTAIFDPQALAAEDTDSVDECRWVLLGLSRKARLLVVIYTLRSDSIRLISARRATSKESKEYAQRI